ncbi:hypothetical protein F511_44646, partial [Dorcoceras hygrometricum]
QITPILACQNLLGYIDGSKPAPSPTTQNTAGVSVSNRAYDVWHTQDQRLLSLLLSSLTEESMAEVIGCTTSRSVWLALEAAFSHRSKSCELRLKDDLQLMKKGNRSVSEYGRQFKSLCDQLAAIGRPVDERIKPIGFFAGLAHPSQVSPLLRWHSPHSRFFGISSPRPRASPCFKTISTPPELHQWRSTVSADAQAPHHTNLVLPLVVVEMVVATVL